MTEAEAGSGVSAVNSVSFGGSGRSTLNNKPYFQNYEHIPLYIYRTFYLKTVGKSNRRTESRCPAQRPPSAAPVALGRWEPAASRFLSADGLATFLLSPPNATVPPLNRADVDRARAMQSRNSCTHSHGNGERRAPSRGTGGHGVDTGETHACSFPR